MAIECGEQHTLWSLITGEPIQIPITGHAERVYKIIFSPSNKHLVTESSDKALIWSLTTGQPSDPLTIGEYAKYGRIISFSPTGKFIAIDGTPWNLTGEQPSLTGFPGASRNILGIFFGSDDKFVVTNNFNDVTLYWDLPLNWNVRDFKIGQPSARFCIYVKSDPSSTKHTSPITRMTSSSNSKFFTTTCHGSRTLLWNLETRKKIEFPGTINDPHYYHTEICVSSDNKFIATRSSFYTADLWDISTGQPVRIALPGAPGELRHLIFSPDGNLVATNSHDETLLWSLSEDHPVQIPLEGHTEPIHHIRFSKDGKFLVTISQDKTIFWNFDGNKLFDSFIITGQGDERVFDTIFLTDRYMATLSINKVVLWDLSTGKPTNPVIITGHTCTHATLSPDNLFLATHSRAQSVLWSLKPNLTLEQIILLKQLTATVQTIKEPINLSSQITALYQTLPAGIQEKFKDKVILDPARATSQPTQSETPTNILDEPAADLTVVSDASVEPVAAAKTTMEEVD